MSLKISATSFLNSVQQSGLIELSKLETCLDDFQRAGVNLNDAASIAAAFVRSKALTDWQCEKLLQGRHKGFILGRYRLMSLLGTGEMSAVYLAEHVMMERRCAIKVLPANKVKDTSYLGRFHREARAVASLNHPNIVRAYDVDKQVEGGNEIHFLIMEYVDGRNLGKTVAEGGTLSYEAAADYIRQAAEGLHHAHQNGLVHRDIKPENLLIDQQGHVRILDLGLARFFNASEEESLTIKHDEKVLGTADYLAPEQAIDSHSVDLRADIYSLGCSLYYALTGHPPFTDGSLVQRLLAHQTRRPPSVKNDRPDISPELLAILDKMMAKRASDRYQTAEEVSQALATWLANFASDAWKQKHLTLVAAYGKRDSVIPASLATASSNSTTAAEASIFDAVDTSAASSSSTDKPRPSSMPNVVVAPRLDRPVAPKPVKKANVAATASGAKPRGDALVSRSDTLKAPARFRADVLGTNWDWERIFTWTALTLVLFITILLGIWLVQSPANSADLTTAGQTRNPAYDAEISR